VEYHILVVVLVAEEIRQVEKHIRILQELQQFQMGLMV
jgi:hypothetical protein